MEWAFPLRCTSPTSMTSSMVRSVARWACQYAYASCILPAKRWYFTFDVYTKLTSTAEIWDNDKTYVLPDENNITVGAERFRFAEILIQISFSTWEASGIHINSCLSLIDGRADRMGSIHVECQSGAPPELFFDHWTASDGAVESLFSGFHDVLDDFLFAVFVWAHWYMIGQACEWIWLHCNWLRLPREACFDQVVFLLVFRTLIRCSWLPFWMRQEHALIFRWMAATSTLKGNFCRFHVKEREVTYRLVHVGKESKTYLRSFVKRHSLIEVRILTAHLSFWNVLPCVFFCFSSGPPRNW